MTTTDRDDLRALLQGVALPGEVDRLAELDDLSLATPVRVYGRPSVGGLRTFSDALGMLSPGDGPAPEVPLIQLAEMVGVLSRPGMATASVVFRWLRATRDEGVDRDAIATARLTLEGRKNRQNDKHADPDDRGQVVALADAWTRHARDFVHGLERQWPGGTFSAWLDPWIDRVSSMVDRVRSEGASALAGEVFDAEWLDERDREIGALAKDGVPWLSLELAAYMRTLGQADDLVDAWLKREREDPGQGVIPAPGMPPAIALPSWRLAVDGCPPGPGVTRAALYLARAVWDFKLRPELEAKRPRYPVTSVLFPVAEGVARGAGHRRWEVSAVDPGLLEQVERSGALETVESHALVRKLPDLARLAANAPASTVIVHNDDAGQVSVTLTANGRTEVEARGGWQAVAAMLGHRGGSARVAVRAAVTALAGVPYRWHDKQRIAGIEGTTTLIADLSGGDEGTSTVRVSFVLPRLWWPGFSKELKADGDGERSARARVPVDPTLPPTTSTKLGDRPAALELRACTWIREHIDLATDEGAPVPWAKLADEVNLSTAKQRVRRLSTLEDLLTLWVRERRWHRAGGLWRPAYGWSGPGSMLEAKEQRDGGKARQRANKRR